ncbi:MAG: 50S ribosomal protein L9 [bacterium]
MKVILLKDVRKMGRAHETIEVSDGHAINFLIPQKLAVAATPDAARRAEGYKAKGAVAKEVQTHLLEQNLATLAEARIVLKMKANEQGHLYNAVGEDEILAAVKEQANVELPEDVIRLEKPIKELGTYDIPVSAGKDFGRFNIVVEAE